MDPLPEEDHRREVRHRFQPLTPHELVARGGPAFPPFAGLTVILSTISVLENQDRLSSISTGDPLPRSWYDRLHAGHEGRGQRAPATRRNHISVDRRQTGGVPPAFYQGMLS